MKTVCNAIILFYSFTLGCKDYGIVGGLITLSIMSSLLLMLWYLDSK